MVEQIPEIPGAKIYYVRLPDPKCPNGRGVPILTVAVAPSLNGQAGTVDRATAFCPPITIQGKKNPDYPPVKRKGRMIALDRLVNLRSRFHGELYYEPRCPAKFNDSYFFVPAECPHYYNPVHMSNRCWSSTIYYLISSNGIGVRPTEYECKLLKITHKNKEEEK
ncbi:MAG: hypothetical protein ACTSQI_22445 [Candidatus Helarchaeota archaeon]